MQAAEVKVRPKNLVVESLQDIIQERISGMQMSVGFNNAGTYKELGGKAEVASRGAVWTKVIGSIIGMQTFA